MCSFYIIWRRLSWENYFFCWCIWGTVHIERKCPALKLCRLLTHAALTDGPSIVRSPFSHLVFLSGIELPHWLKVAHSWNSMKRRCLFDNRIVWWVLCELEPFLGYWTWVFAHSTVPGYLLHRPCYHLVLFLSGIVLNQWWTRGLVFQLPPWGLHVLPRAVQTLATSSAWMNEWMNVYFPWSDLTTLEWILI